MREYVDVMDQRDFDSLDPETLERILERAPRAVVRIVVAAFERQTARPRPVVDRPARRRLQDPPDLGRDDELIARLPSQPEPKTRFGEAVSVERGGVEVTDPLSSMPPR